MLKTDKDTGADLSTGFTFELQTSTDNGTNWTKVDLDASMVEIGTLNGDKTITPDAKGVVQVKKLTGGHMYRFVEKTHADGYQDVTVNNAQPNDKNHVTSANSKAVKVSTQGKGQVIVMYNAKPEKTQVKVTKKWEGPETDSVTIKLLKDGQDSGKSLKLNKAGNWEGTFSDLLKYNKDGSEIKYDVAEVKIDNYQSSKTGDAKTGFIITNKNVEKTQVKVTKKWKGPEKDSVEIKFLKDGQDSGNTLILNKAGNWTGTFENLEKYNADGSEINYDVAEVKIDNYQSSKTGDANTGFTITNTNVEKISIPVEKKWVGKAKDKVEVKLLAGTEVKDTVILTQDNSWKHTFADLPKYDKDGNKIKYDIQEEKVDGYTTGKSGTAENGFTIINTITGKVSVPVTKKWIGKEGDSAIVHLLADGKKVDSVTLNKGNKWQHTFADLEKYKDGEEIKYTIQEVKLPFYDISVSGNAEDGFVITNKHVPPKKEVFEAGTTVNIDGKIVKPDQKLTYAITYKNTTGEERDVTITDKIPAHTTFVSADNGGKYAGGKVTWTKKVADGETFKVTFTVKVDKDVDGATLENTAKVNDGVNDSDTNTVKNPTPKTPKPPKHPAPNTPHGPRTGDDSNIMLLLMLLLASGGTLGTMVIVRRKR